MSGPWRRREGCGKRVRDFPTGWLSDLLHFVMRRPTLALLLLPWLLFGHGVPRRVVGSGERVLSPVSAVDVSASPAFRVDDSRNLARSIGAAQRVPTAPARHAPPMGVMAGRVVAPAPAWSAAARAAASERGFRPLHLAVPHNANAPPASQS